MMKLGIKNHLSKHYITFISEINKLACSLQRDKQIALSSSQEPKEIGSPVIHNKYLSVTSASIFHTTFRPPLHAMTE